MAQKLLIKDGVVRQPKNARQEQRLRDKGYVDFVPAKKAKSE